GFQVVGGKQAQPVKQITIAGNFYQLLKDIEAVGEDLKFGMPGGSCFGSPSLLVSKLSIAGK
ncbi:MAG: TldD/PmbA family protein, partial [Clostridia bacterium]|nr:TldD/PmbA family protein [Clostridia bacterium]